jgi:hypothetical protein
MYVTVSGFAGARAKLETRSKPGKLALIRQE